MTYELIFSVIIPTYNRANLLPRAVQSVLNQTFEGFELIIVDDNSTDETKKVVEDFDDERIIYEQREVNGGVSAALNTGIRRAKGQFICFLGDDDEFLPQFLAETHKAFDVAPDSVGFAWCGIRRVKDTPRGEVVYEEKVWQLEYQSSKQAYLPYVSALGSGYLTVRRTCFDAIELFDETLVVAADTDLILRLACNFDYMAIPKILVKIHKHVETQLTDPRNFLKRLEAHKQILQKNLACLERHPNLWREFHRRVVYFSYRFGDRKQGRKYIMRMIRAFPQRLDLWLDLICFEIFKDQALVIGNRFLPKTLIDLPLGLYRYFQKAISR